MVSVCVFMRVPQCMYGCQGTSSLCPLPSTLFEMGSLCHLLHHTRGWLAHKLLEVLHSPPLFSLEEHWDDRYTCCFFQNLYGFSGLRVSSSFLHSKRFTHWSVSPELITFLESLYVLVATGKWNEKWQLHWFRLCFHLN